MQLSAPPSTRGWSSEEESAVPDDRGAKDGPRWQRHRTRPAALIFCSRQIYVVGDDELASDATKVLKAARDAPRIHSAALFRGKLDLTRTRALHKRDIYLTDYGGFLFLLSTKGIIPKIAIMCGYRMDLSCAL